MCICRTWLKHHTCNVCIACMVNMEACRGTRGTWQVVIFYNLRYEVHVVCTRWHSPYPEHFPYPNTYPWATAQRWSDNRCSTVVPGHSLCCWNTHSQLHVIPVVNAMLKRNLNTCHWTPHDVPTWTSALTSIAVTAIDRQWLCHNVLYLQGTRAGRPVTRIRD